ncbi:MAG: cytochrome c maturation protein CcmE [Magnetovibrionaceae bacterium]
MKRKHKRLSFVVIALLLLGSAAALMLSALDENIAFFHSPSDIVTKKPGEEMRLRLGGLVEEGSVRKQEGLTTIFRVTDQANTVEVAYTGILPDLFREGQGIVAEGRLVAGVFQADEVLAKHDENYMPKEVADALKDSGHWQEGEDGGAAEPSDAGPKAY